MTPTSSALSTILLLLLAPAPAPRQAGTAHPEARALLAEGRLDDAARLLRAAVEDDGEDATAWSLLGFALHAQGELDAAIEAHRRAAEFPRTRELALYNLACAHSLKNEVEEAFDYLSAAREAGFDDEASLWNDGDLDNLREDPRFAGFLPTVEPVLEGDELFVEDTRVLHALVGEAPGDQFGWVARAVGDLDADGVTDFAATAPTNGRGGSSAGRVYVYSSRSGALLFARSGRSGERLGNGVAGAGDVDGDGVPDVVAGAPGAGSAPGRAYVFSGKSGATLLELSVDEPGDRYGLKVAGAGDLDGDGRADVLVGAPEGAGPGRVFAHSGADGAVLFVVEGEAEGDRFGSALAASADAEPVEPRFVVGAMAAGPRRTGRAYAYRWDGMEAELAFRIEGDGTSANLGQYFVSLPGDVDGDGVPDVYASDWNNAAGGVNTGRVFVHSGRDGERILTLDGSSPGEGFGTSPSEAGDVDGDGRADLVVGAWQNRDGAPSGGRVTLHSGRDGALLASWTSRQRGDTLGFDATGLGDVDGDGALDFLVTSAWSPARGPQTGRVFVIAGPISAER